MNPIAFETIDWSSVQPTVHPGEQGLAHWKTIQHGGLRIREVVYSAGYIADHWCELGHIIYCVKGSMKTKLQDGSVYELKEGMSYHVSDKMSSHQTSSEHGVTLFIVDGDFLNIPTGNK